ncbi:MAG TPA: hypothetical protein VKC51_01115 [Lacunisphaera sp.]|nr:hypothetical protein [Lacunisphaera sp.]
MMPGYDAQRIRAQLMVWWIIWAATLMVQCLIYFFLASGKPLPTQVPARESLQGLIGLVPLFVSIVIRWLVLPRYTEPGRALVIFIIGLGLAAGCGILGIFMGGPYRDSLFVLGVLGITQYVPFYARRFFEPKGSGFIPNN